MAAVDNKRGVPAGSAPVSARGTPTSKPPTAAQLQRKLGELDAKIAGLGWNPETKAERKSLEAQRKQLAAQLGQRQAPKPAPVASRAPAPATAPAPSSSGPAPASQAARDAQALYDAMRGGLTGAGTDEGKLFSVLAHRSSEELAAMTRVYKTHYKRDLSADLKSELSGPELNRATALLRGDAVQGEVERLRLSLTKTFGHGGDEVVAALSELSAEGLSQVSARYSQQFGSLEKAISQALPHAQADEARALLKGDRPAALAARLDTALNLQSDADAVVALLGRVDPGSVKVLCAAYQARTGHALSGDLSSRLKGTHKDLAVALLAGNRAGADVARLRHAVEGRFWGLGKDATAALAILQGKKSPKERAALADAYKKKYGVDLRQDVAGRFGGREADRLAKSIEGKLDAVEQLQVSLEGWGADEDAILQVLSGLTRAEVTKLSADFKARTGKELKATLNEELGGRSRFDALLSLEGKPETPEQAVEQARRIREYERGGLKNFASRIIMDGVSGSGSRMDQTVASAESALKKAKADGVIDQKEAAGLAELSGRATNEVRTYRREKDAAAEAMGTVAAVGVTIATAGAGAPLLVTSAASAGASVAIKASIHGGGYSGERALIDGANGLINGLGGAAGSAVVSKAAVTAGGRIAQGAVVGGISGMLDGAVDTATRDETWNAGVAEGLFTTGMQAAKDAGRGAILGAGEALIRDVRHSRKSAKVVQTQLPAEGAVDLSKYKADPAAHAATKSYLGDAEYKRLEEAVAVVKAAHPELAQIPTEDLIALRAYSGHHYRPMNSSLRAATAAELEKLEGLIKTAASALNELPSFQGTVYRGTTLKQEVIDMYVPGQIVAERAFMSTSYEKTTAFSGNVLFMIDAQKGGKAIESLSAIAREKEILFGPGTEFRVLDKTLDAATGKVVIFLQEYVQ